MEGSEVEKNAVPWLRSLEDRKDIGIDITCAFVVSDFVHSLTVLQNLVPVLRLRLLFLSITSTRAVPNQWLGTTYETEAGTFRPFKKISWHESEKRDQGIELPP